MKKIAICLTLICMVSLSLFTVITASAQTEGLSVTSYSWYTNSVGYPVIVGEVQNFGTDEANFVQISGIVITSDGQARALTYALVFPYHLYPGQKSPFYMEVLPDSSYSGDLSWLAMGISEVDFTVRAANTTSSPQLPTLDIPVNGSQVDPTTGLLLVRGLIRNTGNQNIGRNLILATFYNSSGTVVGIGYTESYLTPDYLLPGETAAFTITPLDFISPSQIASYNLLVQTENLHPEIVETPTPSGAASTSPSVSETATSTPTSSVENPVATSFPIEYLYLIIVIFAVIVTVLVALLLRKGRAKPVTIAPAPAPT